jgi:hypothetical protein
MSTQQGADPKSRPISTIQLFDPQLDELPAGDRAAGEGRAWLLRRLRWDERLAEPQSESERGPNITTTACTRKPRA